MSNINDVTNVLFETLQGLKDKSISPEQAKSINHTAGTIIQAGKLQLEAAKMMKGVKKAPELLGLGSGTISDGKKKDLYDQKKEFALELGYDNISVAMATLGSKVFEQRFKDEYKQD